MRRGVGWGERRDEDEQPRSRGAVPARRGRQACGPKSGARLPRASPPRARPRARTQVELGELRARSPTRPGALPARLPGSPPPAISARQQSGNGSGASPRSAGTRPGSAADGPAGSVPPAFVLAAARGARPGAMKGPSVCAERPRSPFILNIIFTSFLTEQRFSWNFSPSSKNTCARVCVCKSSFAVKVGIVLGRGSAKPEAGSERDRNAFLPAQGPSRRVAASAGVSALAGLGSGRGRWGFFSNHRPHPNCRVMGCSERSVGREWGASSRGPCPGLVIEYCHQVGPAPGCPPRNE